MELFQFLPTSDDIKIKKDVIINSQNLILKLFDLYAIMVIMFGSYSEFNIPFDGHIHFKKDRDLIKKNISLIKIICKSLRRLILIKVFASKLCKIYVSLIEIILNILEVGETDYYNWFKLVNQTKIDNLEDQLDDLYQIIGYEMYILYGLVPPKDLVAQVHIIYTFHILDLI